MCMSEQLVSSFKKWMLSSLVVAASTLSGYAQRNTLLVYGTVGAESQKVTATTKANSFNFSPAVGYQWTDHWTGGVSLALSSAKSTGEFGDVKASGVAVGPFVRYAYPLSDIFAVYGQFNANVLSGKTAGISYSGFGASFFPAVGVNLKNGFALNFSFGNLSFTSEKPKDSAKSLTDFKLGFGSGATFGISKNFRL